MDLEQRIRFYCCIQIGDNFLRTAVRVCLVLTFWGFFKHKLMMHVGSCRLLSATIFIYLYRWDGFGGSCNREDSIHDFLPLEI